MTGNHEYFSGAQGWVEYIDGIGWDALHNRHIVITRGGCSVIAGVDDRTARGSGADGHRANLEAALAEPTRAARDAARPSAQAGRGRGSGGIDLQISGHTHGGQIRHSITWSHRSARAAGPDPTLRADRAHTAAAPVSGARRSASSLRARSPY